MDKQQIALIAGSIALILLMYFGFNMKPPKQKLVEKSRAGNVELQETQNAVRKAKTLLPEDVRRQVQGLENIVEGSVEDSIQIQALQSLSGIWFEQKAYIPAGYYAERLADLVQSAESWAIAGSTYAAEFTTGHGAEEKDVAMDGAVRGFENAISLDPDNVDYRINLAICYAENPPSANPMKGIQSLLELNRNHPENTSVLYHLARFGMRTGQYEKAKERLQSALTIDSTQRRLHCLMVDLLKEANQLEDVAQYQRACDSLSK